MGSWVSTIRDYTGRTVLFSDALPPGHPAANIPHGSDSLDYAYNSAYNIPLNSPYNPRTDTGNHVSSGAPVNAGSPIDLSNSGVLHYLPRDEKGSSMPKQNSNPGNSKIIMIFGLFGFAVLMAALIGSVVYIQKKKRLNRARDTALRDAN